MRRGLAELEVPLDAAVVLGIWPTADGGVEVHLSPATFWRVVGRLGLTITSTEHRELLFPHCHRFRHGGIECVTFSSEPVLGPGTRTPGYAMRLT